MNARIQNHTRNVLLICMGSFIFAFGMNYFIIPNQLSEGGIAGLTIVAYYLFKFPPWIVTLVLNIPIFIMGYRMLDKRTMVYTVIGTLASSCFLFLTHGWGEAIPDDPLLASLYSGIFVGGGLGIVLRAGGTTGSSTILARLCQKYWGWTIANAILFFDIVVILGSYFVIRSLTGESCRSLRRSSRK
ncbi:YitT family protein [Paenibacillus beijingensis]|uniref:YitT family protein n=1 Tax=Paenibacillus beijingensis TaxID=1126833 RepID=A0A0D5NK78_9BACL|nr:hypothetical protein VN24_13580 [Paenibacillus beijingensis]